MITVLRSQGDGTFMRRSNTPTGGDYVSDAITGDFNGDSMVDAVAVNNTFANNVSLPVGVGDCRFHVPPALLPPATEGIAADYNDDSLADVASPHEIRLGNSTGVPGPPIHYLSPFYSSLTAGDFNNDGKLDLVGGT